MYIVNVHISVKPGCVEQFRQATIENALQSIEEPGVARFDVLQQEDQPERFLLVEAYRSVDDAAKHKETAHYLRWRDAVAGMMAEPRASVKYANVFPRDDLW